MKTKLKSIITRVVALALTFITGSAAAATPVAVWDGDFSTLTKNGLVLNLNGSAVNDGVITVSSGVKITKTSGAFARANGTTIIAELSDIPTDGTKAARKTLMTTYLNDNGIISIDSIEDGKAYQDWKHGNNASAGTSANPLPTGKCVLAMAYEGTGNASTKGATSYLDGALLLNTPGLVSTTTDINALWIGSYSDGSCVATGMKISKIAIFDKKLSAAEIAAFDWDLATRMYSNTLATNAESVSTGTYGDIVVSGNGYKATKFTAKTKITGGEGSYDKIQYKVNGDNDTRTHTVSGWFKVSAYDRLVYAALSLITQGGDHGGYKVYCNSNGNLEIGKCNGINFNWIGNKVTAQTALQLDTWYYLTFAITKNDANRNAKVAVFVNGSVVYEGTDEFATNLNGDNCIEFDIGADVSAAGLYIDTTAVTDVATIKSWATNEKFVEAVPNLSTATIDGEANWSALDWSMDPETAGMVTLTVAGDSTLTIDKDVSVADLVFTGSGALTIKGDHTLTATSFNIDSFTLASGALSIPANNTLTSVTVEDGAVLTLDVSSAKTLNGVSGAGTFVKTGSAKLSVLVAKAGDIAVNGTTIQIEQGRVVFGDGSKDPLMSDPTFIIGENGSLENYGWFTINGTLTIDSAYDKVIFTNTNADSGTGGRTAKLQGAPAIVKKGAGAITICSSEADIPSITVEDGSIGFNGTQPLSYASNATFDFTQHNKTSAAIAGNFTFSEGYTFKFPNDWAAGAVFQLCSGTLSGIPEGGKIADYTFYCGEESKTADFHLSSNGSIFYNYGVKELTPAGDYAISSLNGETIEEGQTVELTIAAGKTLTIDETAKVTTAVICDGILYIVGANGAEPSAEQLAALNFEGVTGTIVKKWLATMGVININLNVDNGKFPEGDTSDDGMLAGNTPKSSWINTTGATGTLTDITEWKTLTQESAAVSGMTFTWDANTVWGADQNIPILNGYLDDGKADGVTLTLTGVPYDMYDVIIYPNTDDGNIYPAIAVNGVRYTWDAANGKTIIGTDNWGSILRTGVQYGQNALRISDLSGDITIHTAQVARPMRGCVAAIQIVQVPLKELKNRYDAEDGVDVTTSDLNKYIDGAYTGPFTLNLNGGKYIADADFACPVLVINSTGALTIEKAPDYTISADEIAKIAVNEFAGELIYGLPTSTLATSSYGTTYTYGAGSEDSPIIPSLNVTNGKMTLKDGTFYIASDSFNGTQSTVVVTNATVFDSGSMGLGIGQADYILSGATVYTTPRVVLSQGADGRTASLTLNETAELVVTGSTIADQNTSSIMFGHWKGPSTFTLNDDAKFTAEDAQVLVGKTSNNQTININGGTFTAKGIKASGSATGTNELNLNGGELKLGEFGITTYNAARTISVTVDGNAKITSTAAMPITQAITVNAGKKLTFDATAGDIVISGTVINNGDIEVVGGNVLFMNLVAEGEIKAEDPGKALFGYTVTINNCGKFTIPEGKSADVIRLYDGAGNEVQFTDNKDGTVSFDWEITGGACWWDYEFDGDFTSTGTDKTTFANEGTTPYFNEGNTAARIGYATAYRGVGAYPTEFTAILYGKMVSVNKQVEMGFGSTTGGSKISVAIACGDPAKEEVLLLISNGSSVQKTVTMNVPNAYTANHLYAFVCKTVENRTKVVVYLDGKEWDSYTFDNVVTLGSGFQLGSVHGGCPTGYSKANTSNQNAELDFLRVYNVALNSEAMAMYANEYEYISENGKATREFDGSDGQTWATESSATPWTQATFDGESAAVNCPLPNTLIAVSATAAATVTMNLAEAANYESFEVANGAAITFKAGGTVQPNVTGLTSIDTDVTLDYNAIKIGKVDVASGKTLTFDFANYPFNTYFVDDEIEFTGAVSGEGTITAIGLPTTGMRTAVFELNEFGHYALKITVPDQPFVYENGVWTWGEQTVEDADLTANPTVTRSIKSDYEVAIGTYDYIVEDGATLKATGLANTGSVTVNAGGVFDVNGKDNTAVKTILNGGTLANTGNGTSYNHIGTYDITFEDDSIVCVSNLLHSLGSGWNAFDYNLNGHKLTKSGAGEYMIATGTYVGGGTIDVQEGTFTIDAGTIPANTTLTLSVADGATVKFTNGQNKGFTKSGTLNLTGAGTVICDGILPTFDSLEGWAGTVELKNIKSTPVGGFKFNNFTTEGSFVRLNNVKGWLATDYTQDCTIEVVGDGLETTDSSENRWYEIAKLTGTGSLKFATKATTKCALNIKDASAFTGELLSIEGMHEDGATATAARPIYVGYDGASSCVKTTGSLISVADGATISCTLNAENVVFGKTVTIKGAVGDIVAWGLTSEPTLPARVTLVDADGKTTSGRLVYNDDGGFISIASGSGFMIMLK